VDSVSELIKGGAMVNHQNNKGCTALYQAAYDGHAECIDVLITAGADINLVTNRNMTPLIGASGRNKAQFVKSLLRYSPDCSIKDKKGMTALDYAKKLKPQEIINLLVEAEKKTIPISTPDTKQDFTFKIKEIAHDVIQLGQVLGKGAYGTVFKASYHMRDVAVKELLSTSLSTQAMNEFKNEAGVMAGVQSQFIVQLFAITTTSPYRLVMELMPKGSLFSVLQNQQTLPWKIRYQISLDIAFGLYDLHAENILHRDLKSLNVLLDDRMRAKLTDFGLSKVKTETASNTKKENKTVGSIMWMSPELFKRQSKHTKQSDIYALGMTFWEIASRKIPYADSKGEQALVMEWIKQGEKEVVPNDCPLNYATLFKPCWENEPTKRPKLEEIIAQLKSINEEKEDSPYQSNLESAMINV